jgi:hypothetical protein
VAASLGKSLGRRRPVPRPSLNGAAGIDWKSAQKKAARTAKWVVTMTKVRIRKTIAKTRWQLISFNGPRGGESVGIVDLMAIRKDHSRDRRGFGQGDLFQIILIQVKGGGAAFPNLEEVKRLTKVGRLYRARAVLLAQWRPGQQVEFLRLKRISKKGVRPKDAWSALETLNEVFY